MKLVIDGHIACTFYERLLKYTADDWYGKPFRLAPWQEDALNAIFALDDEGNWKTEMVYLEVPKKSGKTEFVAGLPLLMLMLLPQHGIQIYGAAAATRQAMNVFRAVDAMHEQEPMFKRKLRKYRATNRFIRRSDPNSFYAAIAADGDMGDGVNPSVVIADELHRWRTRKQIENWDVLANGGITRRQTLTIAITTAGVATESPLAWSLHEKALNIQRGVVKDPKFYGRIFAADPEDDPADERTWIKANPSLIENGGFLNIQKMREKYEQAASTGNLTSFRRYFLNMWDQRETKAIDMGHWDRSAGQWKAKGLLPIDKPLKDGDGEKVKRNVRALDVDVAARFIDRRCWAGVDISMTTDMSAAVLLFEGEGDAVDVLPFFWLPEKNILPLERKLGVPLRQWAEQGFLELSPGATIDYRLIQDRLEWAGRMFDMQEICWDPWNSRQISVDMIEKGYNCVEIRQGFQTLSEPTKLIIALITQGKFNHGHHPIARWHAGCASTVTDGRDNQMFVKPNRMLSTNRIDYLAAATNAMVRRIAGATTTMAYTPVDTVSM